MATLPQIFEEDIQEINRALHDLLLKSEANLIQSNTAKWTPELEATANNIVSAIAAAG